MKPSEILRVAAREKVKDFKGGARAFESEHNLEKWTLRGFTDPSREQVPSLDRAANIAKALGLELYLGPPRDSMPSVDPFPLDGEDFSSVRSFEEVQPSGGPGTFPGDEAVTKLVAFRKDWLDDKGIDPDQAALLHIRGTSMEPTIKNGHMVLIDMRKKSPTGNPFLFRRDGDLFIKRLSRAGDGLLIEGEDKQTRAEFLKKGEAALIEIIGRAVWSGGDIA